MKRLALFSVFFLIGLGLVFSQSITVTSPSGGDAWVKGSTPTIAWTKSGTMDANVKITLRNTDGSLHSVITMSTPNDGNYPWTVPASLANGDYRIRVKTVDNSVTDDGDQFSVKVCDSGSSNSCSKFLVYKPAEGSVYWKGFPIEIKWKNKIQVLPGTLQARKVLQKVPANKLELKKDMSMLKLVKIEIKSVKCMSVAQMIPKLESMYKQKKLSPENVKTMMKIPWLVELLKWKTIAAMTPDDGSFTWNGSGTFKKGCYVVRITKLWCDASDSDRVATSARFSIIPIQIPQWFIQKAEVLQEQTD